MTVVIVTYNSRHCLPLQHALAHACPHVIVVDNGSEDGTPEQARQQWPHATVLALPRNVGFGAANNQALELARTEWVLLLNPDCVLDAATLKCLVEWGDVFHDAAILAPQLVDAAGRTQVNYRWASLSWASRGGAADGPLCVGFACGAALLLRRSVMPKPLFDERFFLYYEDDDLCMRLLQQRQAVILIPECRAHHRSRGSVRTTSPGRGEYWRGYHHTQSKLIFTEKYRNQSSAITLRRKLIYVTALTFPIRLLYPKPKLLARALGRLIGALHWRPQHPQQ